MTPPASHVLAVCAGGALGAGLRQAALLAWPPGEPDATILAVNVLGAFLLGALLTWLAGAGPDDGGRRTARLLLGTGLLGGFTTYSTLALDTARLLGHQQVATAGAYALATLLLGAGASLAGIRCGALLLGRAGATGARPQVDADAQVHADPQVRADAQVGGDGPADAGASLREGSA